MGGMQEELGSLALFLSGCTTGGGRAMNIPDAKQYIGRNCNVTYKDRMGNIRNAILHIHDLSFVPLYGAYLVGDIEDVCLDRVTAIKLID
ncbi:MAG: hypothetical protein Q7N50_06260 [Armatimonadota bacterium]|nr:hypothetical protein [Armatimonadota bacterium]